MNNKTYQIQNLKLSMHEQLDYENTYIIFKNKNIPTFHNGLLKYKNIDLSIMVENKKVHTEFHSKLSIVIQYMV